MIKIKKCCFYDNSARLTRTTNATSYENEELVRILDKTNTNVGENLNKILNGSITKQKLKVLI